MAALAYDEEVIVIDSGSYCTRIGMAGQPNPDLVDKTVIGKPKRRGSINIEDGSESKQIYTGDDALSKQSILHLNYPVKKGVVTDWSSLECLWRNYFERLSYDVEDHPIMILDSPFSTDDDRETMTTLMFEAFSSPSLYIATTAACSLYASGRTTGCVLESGHGATHIVPFYEGYAFSHLARQIGIAGADVTSYLAEAYIMNGRLDNAVSSQAKNIDIARNIKEIFAAAKSTALATYESSSEAEVPYQLPDGTTLHLGRERYSSAECLFSPQEIATVLPALGETYTDGISSSLFDVVESCAEEIKDEVYGGLIVAGGNTLFSGFPERIRLDILSMLQQKSLRPGTAVSVIAPADRLHSAWIGGATLASMWSTFEQQKISRAAYEEHGASIVKAKCIR